MDFLSQTRFKEKEANNGIQKNSNSHNLAKPLFCLLFQTFMLKTQNLSWIFRLKPVSRGEKSTKTASKGVLISITLRNLLFCILLRPLVLEFLSQTRFERKHKKTTASKRILTVTAITLRTPHVSLLFQTLQAQKANFREGFSFQTRLETKKDKKSIQGNFDIHNLAHSPCFPYFPNP